MSVLGLSLSTGLAQILTNLDNLALLVAVMPTLGRRVAIGGYGASQAIVLALAAVLAEGAEDIDGAYLGYVGVIPIVLGARALWLRYRQGASDDGRAPVKRGLVLATVMFLGLSGDSLAVMAPLLIDTAPHLRIAAISGAGLAVIGLCAVALSLSRAAGLADQIARRAEWISPVIMIAAGLYVLSNTATDTF